MKWITSVQGASLPIAAVFALALALAGCGGGGSDSAAPTAATPEGSATAASILADAGSDCPFVVISDSLAATQNSSMLESQSVNLFPALIARQAGWPYEFARIGAPGFPAALELQSLDPLTIAMSDTDPASWGTRTNPGTVICNVSVPGAKAGDALLPFPTSYHVPDYEPVFVGNHRLVVYASAPIGPKSQVDMAVALQPEVAILWLGSNDVLWAALQADTSYITPLESFKADYAQVIHRVAGAAKRLLVGNIPDVTVLPYLTPAERVLEGLAAATGLTPEMLSYLVGIGPGDYVTPGVQTALPAVGACLAAWTPGTFCPLPASVVFDSEELKTTRAATAAFNAFIAEQAAAYGAVLVDFHELLDHVDAYGLVVGGQRLSTDMLGGVFSLDGIHPTNTGHAVIANAYIQAMNVHFGLGVPHVAVQQAYMTDPHVYPWMGTPPAAFAPQYPGPVGTIHDIGVH